MKIPRCFATKKTYPILPVLQLHRLRTLGNFSIDYGDGLASTKGLFTGYGDGSENVTLKRHSRFFKRCRVYSNPLKISNVGEFP